MKIEFKFKKVDSYLWGFIAKKSEISKKNYFWIFVDNSYLGRIYTKIDEFIVILIKFEILIFVDILL